LSKRYRLGQRGFAGQLREAIRLLSTQSRERDSEILWALRDVSFAVEQGEVVGIIGRNGAGKSTLLKLLARITYPTGGTIDVQGRVASLLEVGTGFHEELTGRENIYLNGSILGMRRREIDARFDDIVEFSGVSRFIDTPIKRYSSGMRLRLGFAVAAHLEPDLLIVDEVLAVGDAEFQKKCLEAMGDLNSSGRTVLFVSHNMAAVENLCDRVMWIDEGRVREDGPTSRVISNYMSSFAGEAGNAYDLVVVDGRRGTGEVRLSGLEFLDIAGNRKDVIRSGDELRVRLRYGVNARVENPHFGLRIHSDMGTLLTDVSTWATGLEIPRLDPGTGTVELTIRGLNLMPTRYYISLWIESTGGRTFYDQLDFCGTFDVEPSDYYGTGRGIDSHFGLVFLPASWTIDHDAASS
jgi:lipopolysaccharide transport system ATP-binding protein